MTSLARLTLLDKGGGRLFPPLGITNLSVLGTDATLAESNARWNQIASPASTFIRFRRHNFGEQFSAWIAFDTDIDLPLDNRTIYDIQISQFDGASKRWRSNTAIFQTYTPKLEIVDIKTFTFLGNTAANVGLDFAAMTEGALNRTAGRVAVIVAQLHSGNNFQLTAALPTGFTDMGMSGTPIVSGGPTFGVTAFYKILTGSETTMASPFAGTWTSSRINYIAYVLDLIGTLDVGGGAVCQATTGDPSPRTLAMEDETDPTVAFMAAMGTGTGGETTFTFQDTAGNDVTPDHTPILRSNTTTVACRSLYRTKTFNAFQAPISLVGNQPDRGNNAFCAFYLAAR